MIIKIRNKLSWLIVLLLISPCGSVFAQSESETDSIVPSPVIITEVQTGSALGSDEFIELYNNSESAVDITGWQLRYSNASTEGDGSTLIAEIGVDSSKVTLEPNAYYVLHTLSVVPADGVAGQTYPAKLSSADKAIGLFAPDHELCRLFVKDALAWGTSKRGEGSAVVVDGSGDRLFRRNIGFGDIYTDANNNAYDYTASLAKKSLVPQVSVDATPGSANPMAQIVEQSEQEGTQSSLGYVDIYNCEIQEEQAEDPEIPEPEIKQPVEQPPATIEAEKASASTVVKPVMPTRNNGLVAPQITELLPNPEKPQTDADDEYVELYNSNDFTFELSGFVLVAGKKKHVFPEGTLLQPRSFTAFFSADTKLTLSNTQGQVYLLDPLGRQIAQTDSYQNAKDGQAWSLANGAWHWTTSPTPNSANIIKLPAAKKSAVKAKTVSSKNSNKKSVSATARKSAEASTSSTASLSSESEKEKPNIHTGVLVMAALFALLYGVYEYRQDLANRIYQFRIHRKARREARHDAKRR